MKAYPQFKWMPIEEQYAPMGGMDLRDYFAAKAMQSLILGLDNGNESQANLIPSTAYGFADAMMKAREQ